MGSLIVPALLVGFVLWMVSQRGSSYSGRRSPKRRNCTCHRGRCKCKWS